MQTKPPLVRIYGDCYLEAENVDLSAAVSEVTEKYTAKYAELTEL